VSFWLENTGDTYLFLSDFELEFDFGAYNFKTTGGIVPPRTNGFLGNFAVPLPPNVVGIKLFTLHYHVYEHISGSWVDLGIYRSDEQYFISVYPHPFYKVFVSRGLSPEDRAIGDQIAEMIREWGLETITVGIEIEVPEEQVAAIAREEIRTVGGVIAIATPRFMDAMTGLWKTLEWHHGEVGMAFGVDKPLLILKDKRVSLGGLPSYLSPPYPFQEFDPYALDQLRTELSTIMPGFREWIETKRRQSFFDSLGKALAVMGAITIISGFIGSLSGTSKK